MSLKLPAALFLGLALSACSGDHDAAPAAAPWVRTQVVNGGGGLQLALTGTVRARYETPVAFRVGGLVSARLVDAGQRVTAGQVLFRLDPRDSDEAVRAAAAERAAAEAALAIAAADSERNRKLFAQGFISRQALERAELSEREVRTRFDAAQARWQQSRNAGSYGVLRATAAGVLTDVGVQPGQVVAPGQALAMLAQDGEREVEVYFPDNVKAPAEGQLRRADGSSEPLRLRELAGAADALSRTWRARYRLVDGGREQALGSVVSTRFDVPALTAGTLEVPLGALDERGHGARVWQVVKGRAQPLPAEVVLLGPETARIRAAFPDGTRLIVLGTHLLKPGMAVRELAP